MYHEVGIAKLSPAQISRLRNGHKTRIKKGDCHKVHLSQEQLKKLNSAHKKGKAYTVLFDPYQIEKHCCGVYGNISAKGKSCKKSAGQGVVSDAFNTAGNITKVIGLGCARKHTTAPKKRITKKGKGLLGDLGNIAKQGAISIAQQGINAGTNYINDKITDKINGMGAAHRRKVGRRVVDKKKTHGGSGSGCGGALYPAGFAP
jgi:hypothetical protein